MLERIPFRNFYTMIRKEIKILFLCLFTATQSIGQTKNEAFEILDKSIGKLTASDNFSITFNTFATDLKDPMQIFSTASYSVYKGGYLTVEGNKFEMQIGPVKCLSNGKLMVYIDESSQSMFVDSIRSEQSMKKLFGEENNVLPVSDFESGTGKVLNQEKVGGKDCYKIRYDFPGGDIPYVLYWVDVNNYQLVLMAEYDGENFDVYHFKAIGPSFKEHDYSVNLPSRPLEKYYGYEVVDNRYMRDELTKKNTAE